MRKCGMMNTAFDKLRPGNDELKTWKQAGSGYSKRSLIGPTILFDAKA
jgi:hypothetical protein